MHENLLGLSSVFFFFWFGFWVCCFWVGLVLLFGDFEIIYIYTKYILVAKNPSFLQLNICAVVNQNDIFFWCFCFFVVAWTDRGKVYEAPAGVSRRKKLQPIVDGLCSGIVVKVVENKGRSLVCEREIAAGEILLVDRAVCTAQAPSRGEADESKNENVPDREDVALHSALVTKILTDGYRGNMSCDRMKDMYPTEEQVAEWRKTREETKNNSKADAPCVSGWAPYDAWAQTLLAYEMFGCATHSLACTHQLEDLAVDRVKLVVALNCHNLAVLESPIDEPGVGLFPLASLVNHSCSPNAAYFCVEDVLVMRASSAIPLGAEICISYIDSFAGTVARRGELLRKFGFLCCCERCVSDAAAARDRCMDTLRCPKCALFSLSPTCSNNGTQSLWRCFTADCEYGRLQAVADPEHSDGVQNYVDKVQQRLKAVCAEAPKWLAAVRAHNEMAKKSKSSGKNDATSARTSLLECVQSVSSVCGAPSTAVEEEALLSNGKVASLVHPMHIGLYELRSTLISFLLSIGDLEKARSLVYTSVAILGHILPANDTRTIPLLLLCSTLNRALRSSTSHESGNSKRTSSSNKSNRNNVNGGKSDHAAANLSTGEESKSAPTDSNLAALCKMENELRGLSANAFFERAMAIHSICFGGSCKISNCELFRMRMDL